MQLKSKFKKSLVVFVYAIVLNFMVMPIMAWNTPLCSVVGFIGYALLTYVLIRKYEGQLNSSRVLFLILLGASSTALPTHIINFFETLVSLPVWVFRLMGVGMGYLLCKKKKWIKITVTLFSLSSCGVYYFVFAPMWLSKLNYGTFTGRVTTGIMFKDFSMYTPEGELVNLSQLKGKVVVLEFWTTFCGYCYKAFPTYEKLYQKYKNNAEVVMYAVHCFHANRNETYGTGVKILDEYGYKFPSLALPSSDMGKIEIGGVPVVLVFDSRGELVFKGRVDTVEKVLKEQLGSK